MAKRRAAGRFNGFRICKTLGLWGGAQRDRPCGQLGNTCYKLEGCSHLQFACDGGWQEEKEHTRFLYRVGVTAAHLTLTQTDLVRIQDSVPYASVAQSADAAASSTAVGRHKSSNLFGSTIIASAEFLRGSVRLNLCSRGGMAYTLGLSPSAEKD